jgi:hypothetical protein
MSNVLHGKTPIRVSTDCARKIPIRSLDKYNDRALAYFCATCVPARPVYTQQTLDKRLNIREASAMRIHLQSVDVVAVIAIALVTALMLAVRFRTTSWRGIVLQALVANAGAIAAVVAFEIMTT